MVCGWLLAELLLVCLWFVGVLVCMRVFVCVLSEVLLVVVDPTNNGGVTCPDTTLQHTDTISRLSNRHQYSDIG